MNNIHWIIIELFNACVGIFLMFFLFSGLIKEKRNIRIFIKITIITLLLFIDFSSKYFFGKIMYLRVSEIFLIACLISFVFYKVKIIGAILLSLLYFVLTVNADYIAILIFNIPRGKVFEDTVNQDMFRLYGILTGHMFSFVLIKVTISFREKAIYKIPIGFTLPLLGLPIIWVIITTIIDFQTIFGISFQTFFYIITFLFFTIICFLSLILMEKNQRSKIDNMRLSITEAQLEMQKEHISQITQKQSQILHMSHDFKQHISVLLGLNESGRYEETTEALRKLSHFSSKGSSIIETGNTMIDAILSIKKEIAERKGIICNWQIVIPPQITVPELEFCSILGNALDNAIEACMRSVSSKPYIKLYMHLESNWFICSIINSIGKKPQIEDKIFKTLKKEAEYHGLGLQSMKRSCKKMNGELEILYDDVKFLVRIMLPIENIGA